MSIHAGERWDLCCDVEETCFLEGTAYLEIKRLIVLKNPKLFPFLEKGRKKIPTRNLNQNL